MMVFLLSFLTFISFVFAECHQTIDQHSKVVERFGQLEKSIKSFANQELKQENLALLNHSGVRCIKCHAQSGATKNLSTAAVAIARVFSGEDISDLYAEPKASEIITRIIGDEFFHNNPPTGFSNEQKEKLKAIFSSYLEKFPKYKRSVETYQKFEVAREHRIPLKVQPRDKSDFEWNQVRLEEELAGIAEQQLSSKLEKDEFELRMKSVYGLIEDNYQLAKERGHLEYDFDSEKIPFVEKSGLDYDYDERVRIKVQEVTYRDNKWKFEQSPSARTQEFFDKHCAEFKKVYRNYASEISSINMDYCK